MSVQFLFSTIDDALFNRNPQVLGAMPNYLVINQLTGNVPVGGSNNTRVHNFKEIGLSRSRNRALELADADIGFISDDDLSFVSRPDLVVETAYRRFPQADLIVFPFQTPDGRIISARRRFPPILRKDWSMLSTWSLMISFRLRSVRASGVRFDEQFGLGARYATGEEAIFLFDCRRRGLSIVYVDDVVAIHPSISSGNTFARPEQFRAKGAVFARIYPRLHPVLNLLASIRFRPFYRGQFGFKEVLRYIGEGSAQFLEGVEQKNDKEQAR